MNTVLVSNLIPRGAIAKKPLEQGQVSLDKDLIFDVPTEYIFDFTLINQANQFGTPNSMFIDNSVNPSQAEIYVDQSGQYFPIPPYSSGWFTLSAQAGSRITVTSQGGVLNSERCFVSFVNFAVAPVVWNGFAPLVDGSRVNVIGVDGILNQGATNPLIVGGNFSGAPVPIKVDANGRVEVVGAAAGGVAYGPDDDAVAPTQAPLRIAGTDTGGLVRQLVTTVAGWLTVDIKASVLPTGAATEASLLAVKGDTANLVGVATDVGLTTINNQLATMAGGLAFPDLAQEVTLATRNAELTQQSVLTGVTDTKAAVDLTTVAVNDVKASVDLTKTAVDDVKTSVDANKASVDLVKATVDLNKTATDAVKTSVDAVKASVDAGNLKPATSILYVVNILTTQVIVRVSNAARKGLCITADGNGVKLLLSDSYVVSASNYSVELASGDYYEVPYGYTGEIRGVGLTAAGTLKVTEFL